MTNADKWENRSMETESYLTTDLGDMNLDEVVDMLKSFQEQNTTPAFKAMWYGTPTPTLNKESGYTFLTNSEYQVAMMNEDKLSMFINCGECGREEFEQEWTNELTRSIKCEGCKEVIKMLRECEQ